MPVIYFAHGKESGPWGKKIEALAAVAAVRGYRVETRTSVSLPGNGRNCTSLRATTA